MAQRRMMSLKIVDTDNFLDMPISARLLYYDLCMRADDDGFLSSPQKVLKIIGATIDDLKVLISKKYIIRFESGICVITDWFVHNFIRSDRYTETEYKHDKSLLQLIDNKYELINVIPDVIPDVIPLVAAGKVRLELGKDRVGKYSCASHEEKKEQEKIPYEEIKNIYNELLPLQSMCKILTTERKSKIKARWRCELKTLEDWKKFFLRVSRSDFLCGRTERPFWADFDWLICPRNCIKVLEDKYNNLRFEKKEK